MLANLYVAGAMRAGTTSVYRYLAQHPDVFMAPVKEPHFLAAAAGRRSFRGPGDESFERELVTDRAGYEALFRGAGRHRLRGEASSQYLQDPQALAAMAALTPEATVVVVLRDPVDRAHSAWAYLRAQGREDAPTLLEGVQREDERRRRHYSPMWWYTGSSRYAEAVERLLGLFGPRAVLLRYEDLRDDPAAFVGGLVARLGLDPAPIDVSVAHNRSRRSPGSLLALPSRLPPRQRQVLRAALPAPLLRRLERLRAGPARSDTGPGAQDRAVLAPLFADDVRRTAELCGLDLRSWPTWS